MRKILDGKIISLLLLLLLPCCMGWQKWVVVVDVHIRSGRGNEEFFRMRWRVSIIYHFTMSWHNGRHRSSLTSRKIYGAIIITELLINYRGETLEWRRRRAVQENCRASVEWKIICLFDSDFIIIFAFIPMTLSARFHFRMRYDGELRTYIQFRIGETTAEGKTKNGNGSKCKQMEC